MRAPHLDLETSGPSATTGTLELASLAGNVWLLVRVGSESEMLDGLTGVLGATEEQGVGTGWGALCELIEGEAFTSGLENAGTGGCGEAEGSDGELGDFEETIAKFQVRKMVSRVLRGEVTNRVSSVILATTTMVLSLCVFCACSLPAVATMREIDIGGPVNASSMDALLTIKADGLAYC